MFDIVQIKDKQEVLDLEAIFSEYSRTFGKGNEDDTLLVSIFTKVTNPGTLLLVAIKDDDPVGFLWAQAYKSFNQSHLRVSEIYAKQGMMGIKLFERAMEWAKESKFTSVKGLVSIEKARGLKRLFKAKEEAILISVEI